jgi:hypothetical protein
VDLEYVLSFYFIFSTLIFWMCECKFNFPLNTISLFVFWIIFFLVSLRMAFYSFWSMMVATIKGNCQKVVHIMMKIT